MVDGECAKPELNDKGFVVTFTSPPAQASTVLAQRLPYRPIPSLPSPSSFLQLVAHRYADEHQLQAGYARGQACAHWRPSTVQYGLLRCVDGPTRLATESLVGSRAWGLWRRDAVRVLC